MGGRAAYDTASKNRGLGGYDSTFDEYSGSECSHATESGFPTLILNDVGENGRSGKNGTNGRAGKASRDAYGTVVGGKWQAAESAGSGTSGGHGDAGGGGGGGGGVAYYHRKEGDCSLYELGPSGGGGGAGGCGGNGGVDSSTHG